MLRHADLPARRLGRIKRQFGQEPLRLEITGGKLRKLRKLDRAGRRVVIVGPQHRLVPAVRRRLVPVVHRNERAGPAAVLRA